uniref:Integrator complex subunit 10 n=1 Tax=Rhabditophanes sp. KR3021 TaxID=114890 RepID=A0AC35TP47_9BILA
MDPFTYASALEDSQIVSANTLRFSLLAKGVAETHNLIDYTCAIQLETPMDPIYQFLDFHGVTRHALYDHIFKDLSTLMLQKVQSLGADKSGDSHTLLTNLLEKSFTLNKVPEIRPTLCEILKVITAVDPMYVQEIGKNKDLYEACGITVKRQIWASFPELFLKELEPIFESYIEAKNKLVLSVESNATNFFGWETTKSKRNWKQIKQIVEMFGTDPILYKLTMTSIKKFFKSTGDYHLLSLRAEIINLAYDTNATFISTNESSSVFSSTLDFIVIEKDFKDFRFKTLKAELETKETVMFEKLTAIALLVADPHITHVLLNLVVSILMENASTKHKQVRENATLMFLIKLIYMGTKVSEAIDMEDYAQSTNNEKYKKLFEFENNDLIRVFLPEFTMMIIDDLLELDLISCTLEKNELSSIISKERGTVPDSVVCFISENETAALIWLHYFTTVLPKNGGNASIATIMRYMERLTILHNNLIFRAPWNNFLVQKLIMSSSFMVKVSKNINIMQMFIETMLFPNQIHYPGNKYFILRCALFAKIYIGEIMAKKYIEGVHPRFNYGTVEGDDDLGSEQDKIQYAEAYNKVLKKMYVARIASGEVVVDEKNLALTLAQNSISPSV